MVESKSTDKLLVLTNALKNVPQCALDRVQSFSLTWIEVSSDVVVPEIKITFK